MFYQKIIETANLIIVNNQNEIFLAKRSENEKHFAGYRSIPWGKLEDWLSIEETLHKEIKEELNVEITNYKKFGIYDYDMKNWVLVKANYYVWEIIWDISLDPNELIEWKRFNIDNKILDLDLAFNHIEILKDFLNIKIKHDN